MKRVLSIILMVMLISPLGLMDASARSLSVDSLEDEVFYSEDLGGTFVRSIKGTVVIVEWIPNDSAVDRFILVNQNGVITLNGDNFITLDTLDISNMEYPKSKYRWIFNCYSGGSCCCGSSMGIC